MLGPGAGRGRPAHGRSSGGPGPPWGLQSPDPVRENQKLQHRTGAVTRPPPAWAPGASGSRIPSTEPPPAGPPGARSAAKSSRSYLVLVTTRGGQDPGPGRCLLPPRPAPLSSLCSSV